MDLVTFISKFSTQQACINHLERLRWPQGPVCCYCGSTKSSKIKHESRYKCLDCNTSYSVLVGTVFESTKLSLPKWFTAIFLIADAKKGISSLQLSRHLEVNKNTAWYLQKRLRSAMEESNLLTGIIEIDETYVGGSFTKMNRERRKTKGGPSTGMLYKKPILGLYQRKGKIILRALNKAWGQEIKPVIHTLVSPQSTLITDGFGGYYNLSKSYKEHVIINHRKHEYKVGSFNMSSIEGFWAMLKRSIIGVYHNISKNHLQDYLNEMAFKFNYRNRVERLNLLFDRVLKLNFP